MKIVVEPFEEFGYIYGLHSGDGVVRYVGQTRRLRPRMNEHVSAARRAVGGDAMIEWINSITELHCKVLEQAVPLARLDERERHWIAEHGRGALFNRTPGGASMPSGADSAWFGRKHAAETRARLGQRGADHHHFGKRSPNARFTDMQVAQIRLRVQSGETRRSVATSLGVSRDCIERIAKGVTYR